MGRDITVFFGRSGVCRFQLFVATIALASLCVVSTQAVALTTVYTTRAAFNAATTSQSIITFNGLTAPNTATQYNSPVNTLTTGGVTFSENGPTGTLYVIDTGYGGGAYFFNGGGGPYLNNNNYYTGTNALTTLSATLPANTNGVAADFGMQSTSFPNSVFTIGLSTGEQFTFHNEPSSPTFTFLGFVSDQPLTSMTFQAAAEFPAPNATGSPSLDNFTLAQVPEPSATLLVFGAAVGILGPARRRNRSC
jgi:hypothetical protein